MRSNGGHLRTLDTGAAGIIEIDRPAARNALSRDMLASLPATLRRWARDPQIYAVVIRSAVEGVFCAGGDVRELAAWARTSPEEARAALAHEYGLNWQLDCFSKPIAALIDGPVMGSGVGLTLYGTHRVAGAHYRFAMPETAIGFFPDVGTAHGLARLPDSIGMYLALTGRSIDRADALALGLVTHCIDAGQFEGIAEALSAAEPVDPVLDGQHRDPGPGMLSREFRAAIAGVFSGDSVAEILRRLEAAHGKNAELLAGIADELRSKSPLALAVTHRAVRQAAGLDLRATLIQDFQIGCEFLSTADFFEGVRAHFVDKDRRPKWQPPSIDGVTAAMVDAFFAGKARDRFELQPRAAMQSRHATPAT